MGLGSGARVLVVDDHADTRELLKFVLEWDGHVVRAAAGGAEALERVAEEAPDVAVVDLGMPGMDGFELVAKLTGNPAAEGTLVVVLTGNDEPEARRRAERAGADAFLVKPVDRATLSACVSGLLRAERSKRPPVA